MKKKINLVKFVIILIEEKKITCCEVTVRLISGFILIELNTLFYAKIS